METGISWFWKLIPAVALLWMQVNRVTSCDVSAGFVQLPFPNKCILFSEQVDQWSRANQSCSLRGGYLITPRDTDSFILIRQKLKDDLLQHVWIGMYEEVKAEWEWLDGTTIAAQGSFAPWAPSQPDRRGPRNECVYLVPEQNLQWDDQPCARPFSHICQYNPGHENCTGESSISNGSQGACFTVHNGDTSWFTARRECEDRGGVLAKVDSQAVMGLLRSRINNTTGGLWIGLRKSRWMWVTGEEATENYWEMNQPSNRGRCGSVRRFSDETIMWDSDVCTQLHNFACDVPSTEPSSYTPLPPLDTPPSQKTANPPPPPPPRDPNTRRPSTNPPAGPTTEIVVVAGGPSAGLTAGLIIVCLVLVLVITSIGFLYGLHKRRGRILRERARAASLRMPDTVTSKRKPNGNPRDLFYVNRGFQEHYDDIGTVPNQNTDLHMSSEAELGMSVAGQPKASSAYAMANVPESGADNGPTAAGSHPSSHQPAPSSDQGGSESKQERRDTNKQNPESNNNENAPDSTTVTSQEQTKGESHEAPDTGGEPSNQEQRRESMDNTQYQEQRRQSGDSIKYQEQRRPSRDSTKYQEQRRPSRDSVKSSAKDSSPRGSLTSHPGSLVQQTGPLASDNAPNGEATDPPVPCNNSHTGEANGTGADSDIKTEANVPIGNEANVSNQKEAIQGDAQHAADNVDVEDFDERELMTARYSRADNPSHRILKQHFQSSPTVHDQIVEEGDEAKEKKSKSKPLPQNNLLQDIDESDLMSPRGVAPRGMAALIKPEPPDDESISV